MGVLSRKILMINPYKSLKGIIRDNQSGLFMSRLCM